MTALTEFLLARIAEDEDHAKRAAFGYGSKWSSITDEFEDWSTVHADGKLDMVGCEDRDVTRHIARHDPSRVLAECEAKRQIIAEYERYRSERRRAMNGWDAADKQGAESPMMRALALPYADHPDCRDEWRP